MNVNGICSFLLRIWTLGSTSPSTGKINIERDAPYRSTHNAQVCWCEFFSILIVVDGIHLRTHTHTTQFGNIVNAVSIHSQLQKRRKMRTLFSRFIGCICFDTESSISAKLQKIRSMKNFCARRPLTVSFCAASGSSFFFLICSPLLTVWAIRLEPFVEAAWEWEISQKGCRREKKIATPKITIPTITNAV